jgi:hypothetical protein
MKTFSVCKMNVLIPLFFLLIFPAFVAGQTVIEIQVSPNVLNLQNQGQVVTIHTNIPYSQVMGSTVSLNSIEINSWKSDNRGYFVAKFLMVEIKDLPLVINDYNTMTLEGLKTNGETFIGTSQIKVINVLPSGR